MLMQTHLQETMDGNGDAKPTASTSVAASDKQCEGDADGKKGKRHKKAKAAVADDPPKPEKPSKKGKTVTSDQKKELKPRSPKERALCMMQHDTCFLSQFS